MIILSVQFDWIDLNMELVVEPEEEEEEKEKGA